MNGHNGKMGGGVVEYRVTAPGDAFYIWCEPGRETREAENAYQWRNGTWCDASAMTIKRSEDR